MEPSRKEDEDRALAFAALALARAVIDTVEKKGLLDAGEIQGLFDQALTSLESASRSRPSASRAASSRASPSATPLKRPKIEPADPAFTLRTGRPNVSANSGGEKP
jgi:hypothetical protein